jgi:hypothetical protein
MKMVFALASMFMVSCASTSFKPSVEVLEASDKKPAWVSITTPSGTEEGGRYFVAFVTVDGDASKSAALNMADEKAFAEAFRSVVDAYMEQNQVGEEAKATVGHRLISATKGFRPTMPSMHISSRYWETMITSLPNGAFKTELRAFSKASVTANDLAKAAQMYADRMNKTPEIQNILKEVGAQQINTVMGK